MPRRFFVTGPLTVGRRTLGGPEAHHLVHVLRMGVGQTVTLFDGCGFEAAATVENITPRGVDLTVAHVCVTNTEAAVVLVLAAAVPKGDRFAWMIEKATELGVHRFVPLLTERSVVVPGEGKLDKMRRTIVEASKQSGRSRLMELDFPISWPKFVEREFAGPSAWVAHPTGEWLKTARLPSAGPIVAAIGPEGGFTDTELNLGTHAGAQLISLGPRVLRIETAALTLAALVTACR